MIGNVSGLVSSNHLKERLSAFALSKEIPHIEVVRSNSFRDSDRHTFVIPNQVDFEDLHYFERGGYTPIIFNNARNETALAAGFSAVYRGRSTRPIAFVKGSVLVLNFDPDLHFQSNTPGAVDLCVLALAGWISEAGRQGVEPDVIEKMRESIGTARAVQQRAVSLIRSDIASLERRLNDNKESLRLKEESILNPEEEDSEVRLLEQLVSTGKYKYFSLEGTRIEGYIGDVILKDRDDIEHTIPGMRVEYDISSRNLYVFDDTPGEGGHPHTYNDGSVCIGNYSGVDNYARDGKAATAFMLMHEFVNHYNPDSPVRSLENQ